MLDLNNVRLEYLMSAIIVLYGKVHGYYNDEYKHPLKICC